MIHYFVLEHVDENERIKLNNELSGPQLTDTRRREAMKRQDPDMPPMPAWWDDDEDDAQGNITAAQQLGLA